MLREAAMSQKRHEKVCYGGSYLAAGAAGFPWSFLKAGISAEDGAKFHLHICQKQLQFINCGRLLSVVWIGAGISVTFTTKLVKLQGSFWAEEVGLTEKV